MNDLIVHLRIVGASLLILSLAHLYFARYFDWKGDAAKLTPINRQIFHVHTFFICLVLVMMGLLALLYPHTLTAPTPLARLVLIGLTVFWVMRLIFQWLVYDTKLWRGHRLNTIVHVVFTIIWSYYALVFGMALRAQCA